MTLVARRVVVTAFGALLALPAGAAAQDTIRIGCPTKTYFPTIRATVAKEKGLFEKEGLRPEITIWAASEKNLTDRRPFIQKGLNALYGALEYMRNNPDYAKP